MANQSTALLVRTHQKWHATYAIFEVPLIFELEHNTLLSCSHTQQFLMTLKIMIPSQLHSQDATSFSSEMKPLLRTCTNASHTEFDVTFTANDIYPLAFLEKNLEDFHFWFLAMTSEWCQSTANLSSQPLMKHLESKWVLRRVAGPHTLNFASIASAGRLRVCPMWLHHILLLFREGAEAAARTELELTDSTLTAYMNCRYRWLTWRW